MNNYIHLEELDLKANYADLEKELENLSKKECLRIEIDKGLENSLKELEDLMEKLPEQQTQTLFEQCTKNAMDAVTGHFGLASTILNAKDGGNVTTLHNFEKGIVATEEDLQKLTKYQQGYKRDSNYDKIKDNIRDNSPKIVRSEYTGEEMERGAGKNKAQLDHVISLKEIDRDPNMHLFLDDAIRAEIANHPDNLKWLDASANASKGDRDLMEWGKEIDPKTGKTNFEKYGIDEKKAEKIYNTAKSNLKKKVIKEKIVKYSNEVLSTGAKDSMKIFVYSAFGVVLKDFIEAVVIELKTTFREFGKENIKEIFKRFARRMEKVWENIKAKWKDIFKGSLEAGIQAFFSNLLVFIINTIFTTLKKIVQIIRAGFTSLYQAVKIIINPPKNIPKDEIYFEASKIFVSGMISAISMLGSEMIHKFLLSIPGFNVFLSLPIPFTDETIGDALSLCISAAGGAVLSTIAIFYMDKWRSNSKIGNLQIQIVTQKNLIVQYKIAKTWFALNDAYHIVKNETLATIQQIKKDNQIREQSSQEVETAIEEFENCNITKKLYKKLNQTKEN